LSKSKFAYRITILKKYVKNFLNLDYPHKVISFFNLTNPSDSIIVISVYRDKIPITIGYKDLPIDPI
jgi:hypothetical protein